MLPLKWGRLSPLLRVADALRWEPLGLHWFPEFLPGFAVLPVSGGGVEALPPVGGVLWPPVESILRRRDEV